MKKKKYELRVVAASSKKQDILYKLTKSDEIQSIIQK